MNKAILIAVLAFLAVIANAMPADLKTETTLSFEEAHAAHGEESMNFFLNRKAEMELKGVTYGLDVSQPMSTATTSCFKSNGYSFLIPRSYRSSGSIDPNVVNTVKNAWAGGIQYVDTYIFPCPQCGNGAGQVQTAIANLRNNGAKFGMLWLDIEGSQYWMSSKASNRAFLESMISGAKAAGVTIGIYSSYYQWQDIMGLDYTGGKAYPLWYAHYDNNPSFSDFVPFGGFKANIKQYKGDVVVCGAGVDVNVY